VKTFVTGLGKVLSVRTEVKSDRRRNWRNTRSLLATLVVIGSAIIAMPGTAFAAAPPAGHTISSSAQLKMGASTTGGGGAIDFWKVQLLGGDQLQLQASMPANQCCESNYRFELFAPPTNDTNFPQAVPLVDSNVGGNTKAVVVLQAPYNGAFILAVCQNISGDCQTVDSGSGANPMSSYTFTPSLVGGGVKATVGAKETRAGATIAKAPLTPIGNFESGGGNGVDFWKIKLLGGDRLQLQANMPANLCCESNYEFNLFPPNVTDTNFTQVNPVATVNVGDDTKDTIVLQAPYNGTFVLAVCQNIGGDCRGVDSGGGAHPMSPYTFTPTLVGGGIKASVGAKETRASTTIAKAPLTALGNFESGGGSAIDFWKVKLRAGDKLQLALSMPANLCCEGNYDFDLFPGRTTDTNFSQVNPVANVVSSNTTKDTIVLQVPSTGTFFLAICENTGDCRDVVHGQGANPIAPYTFTPKVVGGRETRTVLRLSATTIRHGSEKKLKLSVQVTNEFTGHPTGKVTISAGKKRVCQATLTKGKGSCSPGSNTLLGAGKYSLVASFPGSKGSAPSTSAAHTLTVKS
jgi:Bacterial Ig-like domain (group 3)